MTPSPGGTSCLENAEIDLRIIVEYLEASIDEEAFKKELLGEDHKHTDSDFTGRFLSGDDVT
jgi:malate dehydrogenase (quinone)